MDNGGHWFRGKVRKLGNMEGNGPLKAPGRRREIEEDSPP